MLSASLEFCTPRLPSTPSPLKRDDNPHGAMSPLKCDECLTRILHPSSPFNPVSSQTRRRPPRRHPPFAATLPPSECALDKAQLGLGSTNPSCHTPASSPSQLPLIHLYPFISS